MMEVASGKVKPSRGTDIDLFRAWEEYYTEEKTISYDSDEKAKLVHIELDVDIEKPPSTFGQKIKLAFLSFYIPFIQLIQDVFHYIIDVLIEFFDLIKRITFCCMKDPIRE